MNVLSVVNVRVFCFLLVFSYIAACSGNNDQSTGHSPASKTEALVLRLEQIDEGSFSTSYAEGNETIVSSSIREGPDSGKELVLKFSRESEEGKGEALVRVKSKPCDHDSVHHWHYFLNTEVNVLLVNNTDFPAIFIFRKFE